MVDFCTKFRTATESEFVRANELEVGVRYPIQKLENVSTKYGECLRGVIFTPDQKKLLRVYLPHKYANIYTDEELKKLKPCEFSLIYQGQCGKSSDLEIYNNTVIYKYYNCFY